MAEGAGGDIGLAVLELAVDTELAKQGLDAFQEQVAAQGSEAGARWAREFRKAAEAVLGRGIDDIPPPGTSGGSGPRRPGGAPSAGGGTTTVLGPQLRGRQDQLRMFGEAQQQTELLDDIREGLIRPEGATPVVAPQPGDRLRRPVTQQVAATSRQSEQLSAARDKRLNQTLGALDSSITRLERNQKPPVITPEVTTDLPRGSEPPKIADMLLSLGRSFAKSDAGVYRRIDESTANIKELLNELGSDAPSGGRTASGRPALPPQERLSDIRAKLEALGPAPPKPSSASKRFGRKGIEAADPAAVAAWEAEKKAYESWNRKYLRLKKQETAAANEVVAVERRALRQQQPPPPPQPAPKPVRPLLPAVQIDATASVVPQVREGVVRTNRRQPQPRTEAQRAFAVQRGAQLLEQRREQPAPPPPPRGPRGPVLGGGGGEPPNFGPFNGALRQATGLLEQFVAACREAASVLRTIRAPQSGASEVEAPLTVAGGRRRRRIKPPEDKLTFSSAQEALNFGEQLVAPDGERTVRQLKRYRNAVVELRDASDLGEESTRQLTDRVNLLDNLISGGEKVGKDTVAGSARGGAAETFAGRNRLLDEVSGTRRRIERLPEPERPRFRDQLARVELEIEQQRLGTARQLSAELKRQTLDAQQVSRAGERSRPVQVRPVAPAQAPGVDRQTAARFNLRGTVATLGSVQEDLNSIRQARDLNIRASWEKALRQLREFKEQIDAAPPAQQIRSSSRQRPETQLTNLRTSELRVSERVNRLRETTVPGLGKVDTSGIEEFLTRFRQAINRGDLGLARKLKAETEEALVGLETQLAQAQRDPRGFRATQGARRAAPQPELVQAAPPPAPILRQASPVQRGLETQLTTVRERRVALERQLSQTPDTANEQQVLRLQNQIVVEKKAELELERRLEVIQSRRVRTAGAGGGGAGGGGGRGGRPPVPPPPSEPPRRRPQLEFIPERRGAGLQRFLQSDRLRDATSSGLIGGAFPLLFGQGLGASIGGLAGGVGGGVIGGQFGFGLSLVGTAVGAQVDALVARLSTLGSALKDPVKNFQDLAQAGLVSSAGVKKNIEALIASGREAEARAEIELDAIRQFGDTSQIERLSSAQDELGSSFARLSVVIGGFAAGPLADLLERFSGVANLAIEGAAFNRQAGQFRISSDTRNQLLGQARQKVGDNVGGGIRGLAGQLFGGLAGNALLPTLPGLGNLVGGFLGAGVADAQRQAKINQEAIRLLEERRKKSNNLTAEEKRYEVAANRNTALTSNRLNLIRDEAKGLGLVTLRRQKDIIELERQSKIDALGKRPAPAQVEAINLEAQTQRLKVDLEIERRGFDSLFAAQQTLKELEDQRNVISVEDKGFEPLTKKIVAARQKLDLLNGFKAKSEADVIVRGIDDGTLIRNFRNVQQALQLLNDRQATISVDSKGFVDVTRQIVQTQDGLDQLSAKKAKITAELIIEGIDSGAVANSIQNVQRALQELNNAQVSFDVDSSQFNELGRLIVREEQRLQQLQNRQTVVRIRAVFVGLEDGSIPRSLQNIQGLVQNLDQLRATIDISSPQLPQVTGALVLAREELDRLQGRRAQIELEVIERGISLGTVTNSLSNLERRISLLREQQVNLPINSTAFEQASSRLRGLALLQQQAAGGIRAAAVGAGDALIAGSRSLAATLGTATQNLRSALESGFNLLTQSQQQRVVGAARADIQQGIDSGLIDPNKVRDAQRNAVFGSPQELIQIAGTVRGLLSAVNTFDQSVIDLSNARQVGSPTSQFDNQIKQLSNDVKKATDNQIVFDPLINSNANLALQLQTTVTALNNLVAKNWNVFVDVTTPTPPRINY